MSELVPLLLVILLGLGLAGLQAQQFDRETSRLLIASYAAHVLSSFGQVLMTRYYYGGGDILGYAAMGDILAACLRVDFYQYAPELLKFFVHQPAMIPAEIPGQGNATGSMAALAGFLTYLTGGSAYTLCMVAAIGGYFGQVAVFRAFRNAFPSQYHQRLLISAVLIPSAVFWSSGYLKEAFAVFGLGYLVLGIEGVLRRPGVVPVLRIAWAMPLVGLFKPYILAGVLAGTAAWIFFRSSRSARITPVQVLAAVVFAAGGSALLTRAFPSYSLDGLTQWATYYQEVGPTMEAGSNYTIGDLGEKSLAGQLVYAPLALFTALFRPIVFEARSVQVLINSFETTAVLVLLVRAFLRRGFAQIWSSIRQMPMLAFALAFVVVFGTGVGFTTTNLGALSRYRMPLVPFLWMVALVLGARLESKVPVARPAQPIRARRAPLRTGTERV